jgi:hypothetical protein
MAIKYLNEPEAFNAEFDDICNCITMSCKTYDSQVVQIQTAAWPSVYRKFCEFMKTYLEDGSIQVIQKGENKYVVGLMNVTEKAAAVLKDLSREYVVEKIQNVELFEMLQIEMILQSDHKDVTVQVKREQCKLVMLVRGEGEKVKKCIQQYQRLSDLNNLPHESRQIGENLSKFLTKMKQGINDLLKKNYFHVYWRTRRGDRSCVLESFALSEKAAKESVEFLTTKGIKKFKIDRKLLQADKMNVHEENAEVFQEGDGNFVLFFYGNIVPQVVAKDISNDHSYTFKSEEAKLLQRKVVQDFVTHELQQLSFTGKWSVDNTQQKMIIHCLTKEEADGFVAALQKLFYTVSVDVNTSHELIKQFMSKHHDRAAIGEDRSICVTVDIKDELDSLLEEVRSQNFAQTQNLGISRRQQIEKEYFHDVLRLDDEILHHLNAEQRDKLDNVEKSCAAHISSTQGGLLLKSETEEAISHARKQLYDIVKNIAHREESIKIRRDIKNETVKKEIKKMETNSHCSISLYRSEVAEPQYYKCWTNFVINVVIAEGDIENSVSDVLVCLVDENYEPVGRSSERIFKKGGQNHSLKN